MMQLMADKYIADYAAIVTNTYQQWNIKVHPGKSQIIANTDNPTRKQWIYDNVPGFKYDMNGCFTFLGVPHGDKQFVTKYIQDHLKKLYKKIQYIQRIQHMQIRINLYRKLFNYNKVIYLIKHCKYIKEWIPDINKMYNIITSSITSFVQDKHKPTIKWQLSLSQKSGGCGMRAPEHYYPATKISAMSIKEEQIEPYFNFDCNSVDVSSDNTDLLRQQPYITRISAYHVAKQNMQNELNEHVQTLNSFIAPTKQYNHNPEKIWRH